MIVRLRRAIALLLVILAVGIASCGGDREVPTVLLEADASVADRNPLVGNLAEVSPPASIQELKPYLDVYAPQVHIASPNANERLQTTRVEVDFQVRDLPIYKDATLDLGPHLHVALDDQPYQEVYDLDEPLIFEDVAPGTHTLRAFAVRPWGESFKNEGAYDQVTFSVFTTSRQNNPDNSLPLLAFNEPQGQYGAEPILLDFYLSNAPLHVVAENDEAIADWRIRCTVNGQSFVFDRWQPIYLQGLQPGSNWVKLEVIDENSVPIENVFNSSIRLIEYTPGGTDSLARLVRGEIPLEQAKVLVDPTYTPPQPPVVETTEPEPEPDTAATAEPETLETTESESTVVPAATPATTTDEDAADSAGNGRETETDLPSPEPPATDAVNAPSAKASEPATADEDISDDDVEDIPEAGDRSATNPVSSSPEASDTNATLTPAPSTDSEASADPMNETSSSSVQPESTAATDEDATAPAEETGTAAAEAASEADATTDPTTASNTAPESPNSQAEKPSSLQTLKDSLDII